LVDLLLEVIGDFLVLALEQRGGFLAFNVHIFEQLAQLGELSVALLVDLELATT
jgi:hypothetical protein